MAKKRPYGNMFLDPRACENCGEVRALEWHDGWICERCHAAIQAALQRTREHGHG